MKNGSLFVLSMIMLLAMVPARGQYSDMYYHRVGDTVVMRSPIGYYSWWEWENYYASTRQLTLVAMDAPTIISNHVPFGNPEYCNHDFELMQLFYTPVPLKIIGIAGSPISTGHHGDEPPYSPYTGEPTYQEYFRIYEASPAGHPLVAQAAWRIFDPHRYLLLRGHKTAYPMGPVCGAQCCCNSPWMKIIPLYEYYFDTAIYVTDSFYVGGTMFSKEAYENDGTTTTRYYSAYARGLTNGGCGQENMVGPWGCAIDGYSYMYRGAGQTDWVWTHVNNVSDTSALPYVQIIFPIVEVDTTVPPEGVCVPVEGVQVTCLSDTEALVSWDGFPNYTAFDLSYGIMNVPEDQWPTVRVEDALMYTIRDLDTTFPFYCVKVRAICDDEKNPTAWSERVCFQRGAGAGAADRAMLSQFVFLAPNPAHDVVTVSSSFSLQRIDIYNTNGLLVYSEPAGGHEFAVPLHDFLPGIYMMEIATFGGTTHKKFVKAR